MSTSNNGDCMILSPIRYLCLEFSWMESSFTQNGFYWGLDLVIVISSGEKMASRVSILSPSSLTSHMICEVFTKDSVLN